MNLYAPDTEEKVLSQTAQKVKIDEPSMYRVLLHNDDYTSMEFVVEILMIIFNKSIEKATGIMLNVHNKGIGVCGVYTYEIAETKVKTVHSFAMEKGFPLKCTMERD